MPERKKQSEKIVERKLCDAVKALGGTPVKMSLVGSAGFPDRLIILPGGRIIFVECKTTGEKLRRLQQWWRDHLLRLGCEWHLLDHTDNIDLILSPLN